MFPKQFLSFELHDQKHHDSECVNVLAANPPSCCSFYWSSTTSFFVRTLVWKFNPAVGKKNGRVDSFLIWCPKNNKSFLAPLNWISSSRAESNPALTLWFLVSTSVNEPCWLSTSIFILHRPGKFYRSQGCQRHWCRMACICHTASCPIFAKSNAVGSCTKKEEPMIYRFFAGCLTQI